MAQREASRAWHVNMLEYMQNMNLNFKQIFLLPPLGKFNTKMNFLLFLFLSKNGNIFGVVVIVVVVVIVIVVVDVFVVVMVLFLYGLSCDKLGQFPSHGNVHNLIPFFSECYLCIP